MDGRLFLDSIVRHRAVILELLAGKDESLLVGRDAFLLKDLIFDTGNSVRTLYFNGYSFPGEGLDEDLHLIRLRDIFLTLCVPHTCVQSYTNRRDFRRLFRQGERRSRLQSECDILYKNL